MAVIAIPLPTIAVDLDLASEDFRLRRKLVIVQASSLANLTI